jgi:hypothetical protein
MVQICNESIERRGSVGRQSLGVRLALDEGYYSYCQYS